MSFITWKKEFYPVPAYKVEDKGALVHSFRKWLGLLPHNLEKHRVTAAEIDKELPIDSDSCALCFCFYHTEADTPCVSCPLFKSLGRKCDGSGGVYAAWAIDKRRDPFPMFLALTKALGENHAKANL